MTIESQSLGDDLAFLRAAVEGGGRWRRPFGVAYFAAGVAYGVEMFLHAGQTAGLFPGALAGLAISLGPTAAFLTVFLVRKKAVTGGVGTVGKAQSAVVGLAAWRERSLTTWLIYPCAVFILQGAGWMVLWVLRRRVWIAAVAAGWVAAALAMALTIDRPAVYIAIAGAGLVAFMAVPGFVLMCADDTTA
jgi:hypothetical protein